MISTRRVSIIFVMTTLFFFGCKSEVEKVKPKQASTNLETATARLTRRIDTKYFSWARVETFKFKDRNGKIQSVIPPWGSGATTTIPDDIRYDYRQRDGWRLLYNLFDQERYNPTPMLILYNKYRGIVRYFYYHIKEVGEGSNYVSAALSFDGRTTSHLNFSGDIALPIGKKQDDPFEIKSNIGSLNTGNSYGTWYSFDHEFAYDPNVANYGIRDISMTFRCWAVKNSLIKLDGSVDGKISGYIQTSGSSLSLFNNLISDFSISKGNHLINNTISANTGAQTEQTLEGKLDASISSGLASSIGSSLSKLTSGGLDFLSSPLSKLFNSAISTAIDNKQKVNLDLSAKIAMEGHLESQNSMFATAFILPGTQRNQEVPGYYPYVKNDKPLGLFNISATPVLERHSVKKISSSKLNSYTESTYHLKPNSFDLVVNPDVMATATITNVKKEILWMKQYQGEKNHYDNDYNSAHHQTDLVNISAGNEWYLSNRDVLVKRQILMNAVPAKLFVRVSFTVQPNDGAAPVHVVKTFEPVIEDLGVKVVKITDGGGIGGKG